MLAVTAVLVAQAAAAVRAAVLTVTVAQAAVLTVTVAQAAVAAMPVAAVAAVLAAAVHVMHQKHVKQKPKLTSTQQITQNKRIRTIRHKA
jgi:hypothetical protein